MEIKTITAGKLNSNAYVVSSEDDAILIDPGSDEEYAINEILDLLVGKKLHAIIYTHNHYDHIGGGHKFSNAPHYMHEEDIKMLPTFSNMARTYFHVEFSEPQVLLPLPKEFHFGNLHIKIIHTLGHSSGGVCLHLEDVLFTGDTLFAGMHGRTDLGGDMEAMKQSLALLATFPDDTRVYPGHGVATVLKLEKKWIKQVSKAGWPENQEENQL